MNIKIIKLFYIPVCVTAGEAKKYYQRIQSFVIIFSF